MHWCRPLTFNATTGIRLTLAGRMPQRRDSRSVVPSVFVQIAGTGTDRPMQNGGGNRPNDGHSGLLRATKPGVESSDQPVEVIDEFPL